MKKRLFATLIAAALGLAASAATAATLDKVKQRGTLICGVNPSLAGFGIPSVLVTSKTDIADADNLVVITVPTFSSQIGTAILQALPAQLLIATLSEELGLPVCNFRYRQTDTKRD